MTLTSPGGTTATLLDRALAYSALPAGSGAGNIDFVFSSTHFWGEFSFGDWRLNVANVDAGTGGTLNSW